MNCYAAVILLQNLRGTYSLNRLCMGANKKKSPSFGTPIPYPIPIVQLITLSMLSFYQSALYKDYQNFKSSTFLERERGFL